MYTYVSISILICYKVSTANQNANMEALSAETLDFKDRI
jgi:hypothetical protein